MGQDANQSGNGTHRSQGTMLSVVRGLQEVFPWRHALEGEPVGLLLGEREQPVRRALLVLDCHAEIVAEARQREAQLILALEPPWREPPVDWTSRTRQGRLALLLAREQIGLVVGGTAWQSPPGGLCDAVMEHFKVRKLRPLQPSPVQPRTRVSILATPEEMQPLVESLRKAGVADGSMAVHEIRLVDPDRVAPPVPYRNAEPEAVSEDSASSEDEGNSGTSGQAEIAEEAAIPKARGKTNQAESNSSNGARKTRRKSQAQAKTTATEPEQQLPSEGLDGTSTTPSPQAALAALGTTEAYRIEVTVFEEQRKSVVTAASGVLADQDARVDHVRLANTEKPLGLGRVGELPSRLTAKRLSSDLTRLLRPVTPRVYGSPQEKVKRLAVSLRADAEAVQQAINYGAGCLIGGDLDFEGLRLAQDANLVVLDPGFPRLANWALSAIQAKLAAGLPGVELLRSTYKSAYDG